MTEQLGNSKEGMRKDRIFWVTEKPQTHTVLNIVLLNVTDQADKEQEFNHGLDPAFTFIWKITAMVGRQVSFQCIDQRNDLQMPSLLKQDCGICSSTASLGLSKLSKEH